MGAGKKKVVIVGESLPEHHCRYQETLGGHAEIAFAHTVDESLRHIKDADIIAINTRCSLLFNTLIKRNFKGYVVPISNARPAQMSLPGGKAIQVVCSHSAPGMIAQILESIREGIPSPFPTLPVVLSARNSR